MSSVEVSFKWKTVAICSILLNLGAVATVACVAASKNADTLNTLALALGVIAFVCQLMMFGMQRFQDRPVIVKCATSQNGHSGQCSQHIANRTDTANRRIGSALED